MQLDLDAPGEGRRQLAQLASGLGQGVGVGPVEQAIRATLRNARRPANRCPACSGIGLDPAGTLACGGCGGYGVAS